MNGNKNPVYQNLGFIVKILLRGKCTVVNAHIKTVRRYEVNSLSSKQIK